MSSRWGYLLWLNSGLFKLLLILITVPANKGVAQFKTNWQLPVLRQELIAMKDLRRPEWSTGNLRSNYVMGRGTSVGISNRLGNQLLRYGLTRFGADDYQQIESDHLTPFPGVWIGSNDKPAILSVNSFNVEGMLNYDKGIDKMGFSLQGQIKLSSRISIQMEVFVFHVPGPGTIGAGKVSSVSPYRLQGFLNLQKPK